MSPLTISVDQRLLAVNFWSLAADRERVTKQQMTNDKQQVTNAHSRVRTVRINGRPEEVPYRLCGVQFIRLWAGDDAWQRPLRARPFVSLPFDRDQLHGAASCSRSVVKSFHASGLLNGERLLGSVNQANPGIDRVHDRWLVSTRSPWSEHGTTGQWVERVSQADDIEHGKGPRQPWLRHAKMPRHGRDGGNASRQLDSDAKRHRRAVGEPGDKNVSSVGSAVCQHVVQHRGKVADIINIATCDRAATTSIVPDARVFLGCFLVGSSRVDLQACKLEYSIVSPK